MSFLVLEQIQQNGYGEKDLAIDKDNKNSDNVLKIVSDGVKNDLTNAAEFMACGIGKWYDATKDECVLCTNGKTGEYYNWYSDSKKKQNCPTASCKGLYHNHTIYGTEVGGDYCRWEKEEGFLKHFAHICPIGMYLHGCGQLGCKGPACAGQCKECEVDGVNPRSDSQSRVVFLSAGRKHSESCKYERFPACKEKYFIDTSKNGGDLPTTDYKGGEWDGKWDPPFPDYCTKCELYQSSYQADKDNVAIIAEGKCPIGQFIQNYCTGISISSDLGANRPNRQYCDKCLTTCPETQYLSFECDGTGGQMNECMECESCPAGSVRVEACGNGKKGSCSVVDTTQNTLEPTVTSLPKTSTSTPAICDCENGIPAQGDACPSQGASICAACNPGYGYVADTKSCTQCTDGNNQYNDKQDDSPCGLHTPCGKNQRFQYSPSVGKDRCSPCGQDEYQPEESHFHTECKKLGKCKRDVCVNGENTFKESFENKVCQSATCTPDECCVANPKCTSNICTPGLYSFDLSFVNRVCKTQTCSPEECCRTITTSTSVTTEEVTTTILEPSQPTTTSQSVSSRCQKQEDCPLGYECLVFVKGNMESFDPLLAEYGQCLQPVATTVSSKSTSGKQSENGLCKSDSDCGTTEVGETLRCGMNREDDGCFMAFDPNYSSGYFYYTYYNEEAGKCVVPGPSCGGDSSNTPITQTGKSTTNIVSITTIDASTGCPSNCEFPFSCFPGESKCSLHKCDGNEDCKGDHVCNCGSDCSSLDGTEDSIGDYTYYSYTSGGAETFLDSKYYSFCRHVTTVGGTTTEITKSKHVKIKCRQKVAASGSGSCKDAIYKDTPNNCGNMVMFEDDDPESEVTYDYGHFEGTDHCKCFVHTGQSPFRSSRPISGLGGTVPLCDDFWSTCLPTGNAY